MCVVVGLDWYLCRPVVNRSAAPSKTNDRPGKYGRDDGGEGRSEEGNGSANNGREGQA